MIRYMAAAVTLFVFGMSGGVLATSQFLPGGSAADLGGGAGTYYNASTFQIQNSQHMSGAWGSSTFGAFQTLTENGGAQVSWSSIQVDLPGVGALGNGNVPEPLTALLGSLGLCSIAGLRRLRK